MTNVNTRFVKLPQFQQLDKQNLQYRDVLVYASLKSFNNDESDDCYPSYETIAKHSGVGRSQVIASITRLEKAKYIEVERPETKKKGNFNRYYFLKDQQFFKRVPYEIFDANLTSFEKAMLLCFCQECRDGVFNFGYSIKDFAFKLGLTYDQVIKQYKSLAKKGFISETKNRKGKRVRTTRRLTDKINWSFDYGK